jgi:hypothetical protein
MSGSKPACALREPVAESVASVRPCHAFSITTMVAFSMPRWCPCRRASLIAASLASAPELQKNALSMFAIAQTFAAARSCSATRNRLEVWMSLPTCSCSAFVSTGWAWPRPFTAMPARPSRYFFPSVSQSQAPSPRANDTGCGE